LAVLVAPGEGDCVVTRFAFLPVIAALILSTAAGRAQAVFCTNCSTELTQLANNLQLVDQLARQVELVRESVQQTANLALNTQPLDNQSWGTTLAEIRRLSSLLGQAKSLSFASADLDARFGEKYKDYNGYVRDQTGEDALSAKLQQWSEDTNASVLTTLKAAGLSSTQMEGEEDDHLRGLERLAETAEGRMQAIQVGNQIAMAAVRQTQKLRQTMLLQVQLLANFVQQQGDRQTSEAARWENFSKALNLPTGNGQRY
jgi:type IV secretion system protein TrbJ